MTVYTRTASDVPPNTVENEVEKQVSPTLIFQKWQAYDRFLERNQQGRTLNAFEITNSRRDYLENIARAIQSVYDKMYSTWYDSYTIALKSKDVHHLCYKTVWRLLVGYGTNPTLESGIILHHLYGFPYIPASEVKGLLHHVAEMQIMVGIEGNGGQKLTLPVNLKLDFTHEPPEDLVSALIYLKKVKALFGSINLERGESATSLEGKKENKPGKKAAGGFSESPRIFARRSQNRARISDIIPPLEILQNYKKEMEKLIKKTNDEGKQLCDGWKKVYDDLKWLIGGQIGGILHFYDAVPAKNQTELLQLDVLTPHYKNYYEDTTGTVYPSDDQAPNPILFLAVRPDVLFYFFFKIDLDKVIFALRRNPNDLEANQILDAINTTDIKEIEKLVKEWFEKGLNSYGLGAKTASGYGYFRIHKHKT